MATPAAMIELIDARIESLIEGGAVERYVVGGKDVTHYSLGQLESLRNMYARQVRASGSGGGMGHVRTKRAVDNCD